MINHDLRTIRFMTEVIIRKTAGHKRRNKQINVLRLEIERIEDYFQGQGWRAGELTVLTQIVDGLRSLRTLAHPSVVFQGDPETNRDVEARLWLLHDLAAFLVEKVEETQMMSSTAPTPQDEDLPF